MYNSSKANYKFLSFKAYLVLNFHILCIEINKIPKQHSKKITDFIRVID